MTTAPSGCRFSPAVVGDPVDTLTGALLDRKLEFRLIGPLELSWWRHYDSAQSGQRFSLGWGQAHEFDRILYLANERTIYGHPVGQQTWFPLLARDGEEATAQGFTLRRHSTTRYELHRHGEPSMEFVFASDTRRARPCRLFTADGEIRLFHNERNRLERIIHSTGDALLATLTEEGLLAQLTLERRDGKRDLLVAYTYDERGNLIRSRDGRGHGYEFTYDTSNRLTRRRGRKGFTFRYKYDAAGRCVFSAGDDSWYGVALTYDKPGRLTLVRRPDGGIWAYKFLPGGQLAEIRDPLGGVRKLLYDGLGQMTHEVDARGNVTEYVLNESGAPVRKIMPTGHIIPLPEDASVPDPLAAPVALNPAEYHFGSLFEVARILPLRTIEVAALAIPPAAKALASTRRDPDPVAAGETPYVVKPLGIAWWPAPSRGRIFNELGKLIEQRDNEDRVRQWSYDGSGNLETYRDFDGGLWQYDFGRWHLLRSFTTPIEATTSLTYTTNEQVSSCRDPGDSLSEYRYDQADRLVEVKRHGVVRETYARNEAGNLSVKRAGDGRVIMECEFGASNLLTRRVLASGGEHRFAYDRSGRCTRATTTKDAITRTYRPTGQLMAELRDGRGLEYRRNGGGEPVDAVWFDRFTVRYDRSETSSLQVTDSTGGHHRLRWFDGGFVIVQFANGTREISQFDDRGRCLFKHLERAGGMHWSRRYHWSGEGELRCIDDSSIGKIEHDYDAAHRLRGRTIGRQVEHYVQDKADNLLAQPGLSGVVLRDGNRLAEANGARFEYNDRNHIARWHGPGGTTDYTYDSRDLLIRVATREGLWTAEYDAFGRRTRKTWQGKTTEFYWFGDQLIAEVGPGGNLRLYVYADSLALTPLLMIDYDSPNAPLESGRVGTIIADQLGTPVLVEGKDGQILWHAQVAPFGTAEVACRSKIQLALRFPGQYDDSEIGLHCNGFRHYSPTLGRYLQSDPWGTYGGTNLYAFRTNPLLAVDVRGLGEEGDPSKKKPPADEEGAGPKKQPGGEQEGGQKKALKDMTPEELKAHVENRADELKKVFQDANPEGEKRTTLSVGVVETGGDPETRRVVVSTSADDQRLPAAVKENMRANGEAPMQGEPFFVRQPNPGFDESKPPGPDNPKTRVHEVDMDKGTVSPEPYDKAKGGDPPSGTRHHAEQRMEMGAAEQGEQVLAQQPTKPCCSGCTTVLGDNGKLSKVPNP